MKKSNYIVLAIAAIAAALLLALWYYLGFNFVDNPLDLVLSIIWWLAIVVIAIVIAKVEEKRRRQIRTIYVSSTALFNSERGMVGASDVNDVEAMQDILENLKYGFGKEDLPDDKHFEYLYVVQTDEYKGSHDDTSDTEENDPKWKGIVTKIDHVNGNVETEFDGITELRSALA